MPEQSLLLANDPAVTSDQLDDLVHDTASSVASDVNNEGKLAQLAYLNQSGWSEEQIRQQLALNQ